MLQKHVDFDSRQGAVVYYRRQEMRTVHKIYNYKPGDKVITPTGQVATVVKETYGGERLILEYVDTPEWQKVSDDKNIRHINSVTLQKEFVKPLKQELYSTCQVTYK